MNLTYILLGFCLFFCVLNLVLIFFIGLFLVRFQQGLFIYLNNFENSFNKSNKDFLLSEEKTTDNKTWDQKYEDELTAIAERISRSNDDV